jgi:hypothetical protein
LVIGSHWRRFCRSRPAYDSSPTYILRPYVSAHEQRKLKKEHVKKYIQMNTGYSCRTEPFVSVGWRELILVQKFRKYHRTPKQHRKRYVKMSMSGYSSIQSEGTGMIWLDTKNC